LFSDAKVQLAVSASNR